MQSLISWHLMVSNSIASEILWQSCSHQSSKHFKETLTRKLNTYLQYCQLQQFKECKINSNQKRKPQRKGKIAIKYLIVSFNSTPSVPSNANEMLFPLDQQCTGLCLLGQEEKKHTVTMYIIPFITKVCTILMLLVCN